MCLKCLKKSSTTTELLSNESAVVLLQSNSNQLQFQPHNNRIFTKLIWQFEFL